MKIKVFIGFFIACFLLAPGHICAQHTTEVTVTDIGNVTIKEKMEQEASRLLTAFNDAYKHDKQPDLKNVRDRGSVSTIWAISPLFCVEPEIIERGYNTSSGYQIRNIPMFLKNVPEEDDPHRDIVINFDRNGNITNIHFTISIGGFLLEAKDVTDLRQRLELIDFIEKFRTAYNRKDIDNISNKFSEDAEIFTGRVIRVKKVEGEGYEEKIEYFKRTKKEYIDGLRSTFRNNKVIDVKFDKIEVLQHKKYDHIYGIMFTQDWYSTNYGDFGHVFLYIDFKDKNKPLIKVRAWQPEQFGGQKPSLQDLFDKFLDTPSS